MAANPFGSTCWEMIRKAARGEPEEREAFARRYLAPVRDYLTARWRGSALAQEVEDAVQEVFVECFRTGGVLTKADAAKPGGFRAFLFGVTRNIALRVEERAGSRKEHQTPTRVLVSITPHDDALTRLFERAWALNLVREAARLQEARASAGSERERRWVELLRLRFEDNLPIREIARLWQIEAAQLHREYVHARHAFRSALMTVVAHHNPGAVDEIETKCRAILALLA